MEKIRKKRFQRVVCYFHHLELSFGKIIHLYGVYTLSPKTFVEPWETMLGGDIHKDHTVSFKNLPNHPLITLIDSMTPEALMQLGTDHRVFIGCVHIIITIGRFTGGGCTRPL